MVKVSEGQARAASQLSGPAVPEFNSVLPRPLRLLGHGARGLESMETETSEWEGG